MKKMKILICAILLMPIFAFANKTSITIDVPQTAAKGSEITIKISVTHSGNSAFHFTDWVILKINGVEVKKWNFTKKSLPDGENFVLAYKFILTENINIEAQGNCNLHGSAGAVSKTVKALDV